MWRFPKFQIKMQYIEFLQSIAERAYKTAYDRGKKPNVGTCIMACDEELKEYWAAHDNGRRCQSSELRKADGIKDDAEFVEYYDSTIHNTTWDELADLCIVSATWCYSAYVATVQNGDEWNPNRDLNTILCCGPLSFVLSIVTDAETLRLAINNKLRYNELRKD